MRSFTAHADEFPWAWSSRMADEWLGDLRALCNLKRSTLRNYQNSISLFCAYLVDPAYQWAAECEQRFGTHPVQVIHEWNTAVHLQEAERREAGFHPRRVAGVLRPRRRPDRRGSRPRP
ncbi:hypothetical protein [Nocardia sp. NPDC004750]